MKRKPSYSFFHQLKALVVKSATNQLRQYGTNACQLLFPVVMLVVLFLFQILVTDLYQEILGETSPAVTTPSLNTRYYTVPASGNTCPDEKVVFSPLTYAKVAYTTYGADLGRYAGLDPLIDNFLTYPALYVDPYSSVSPEGLIGNFFNLPNGSGASDASSSLYDLLALQTVVGRNFDTICFNSTYALDPQFVELQDKESLDETIYDAWGNDIYVGAYDFVQADRTSLRYNVGIYSNLTTTNGRDLLLWASNLVSAIWRDGVIDSGDFTLFGTKGYPKEESINDFDLISLIGTQIYIFVFQLLFPVILTNVVYEKETNLRGIMSMMGLKTSIYWLVTYVFNLFLYLIALLLIYVFAYAFDFRFFTVNDFGTHFILFFLWGNVMVALAFFMSVFFTKSLTATVLGYIIVFGTGILSTELVGDFLTDATTDPIIISLFCIYPPFALYRGLIGLSNGVVFGGTGMRFSEISGKYYELDQVYLFLVIEWAVLLLLAIYLELVLKIGPGVKLHPLFCFTGCKSKNSHQKHRDDYEERHDVKAERKAAEKGKTDAAVRILNLRKKYGSFVAVQDLSMTINPKECFGFLGPNGAGKSTTINMLCGYLRPDSGTANINGYDLIDDTDAIHLNLGVCPQDNVLWDDLTGPEHLYFYGRLKGLSGDDLAEQVDYWLGQVNLLEARKKLSSQYSGGMKRRLCVAIALIGDPSIVLLDEPTTGLDPASKRSLWEVINKKKKECSILLTTHSMEEAEALCDRLGIFIAGRLSTLGSPADLKTRYGKGYKLTITTKYKAVNGAKKFLQEHIPEAEPISLPIAGTQNFSIPRGASKISEIFDLIENNREELKILDWGITNSTLEEVFLYIVDKEQNGEKFESYSIEEV
eukprot:TRINITY_DN54_c1_g1_i1.p1 TRINITY_DN54_c1_g1~~TRINITY_DN54_c1_g1_i1.p1  ORF type:complete len:873 (+),score=187.37 TRINITY_DN54_c1_g1_i1:72-2690(+)